MILYEQMLRTQQLLKRRIKPCFTKEQIIDAAFEIARTEGVDAVTIRKVSEKLGAP